MSYQYLITSAEFKSKKEVISSARENWFFLFFSLIFQL